LKVHTNTPKRIKEGRKRKTERQKTRRTNEAKT